MPPGLWNSSLMKFMKSGRWCLKIELFRYIIVPVRGEYGVLEEEYCT